MYILSVNPIYHEYYLFFYIRFLPFFPAAHAHSSSSPISLTSLFSWCHYSLLHGGAIVAEASQFARSYTAIAKQVRSKIKLVHHRLSDFIHIFFFSDHWTWQFVCIFSSPESLLLCLLLSCVTVIHQMIQIQIQIRISRSVFRSRFTFSRFMEYDSNLASPAQPASELNNWTQVWQANNFFFFRRKKCFTLVVLTWGSLWGQHPSSLI